MKTFRMHVPLALAAALVGLAPVLAEGGALPHEALHAQNPLVARFKGVYPSRTHVSIGDASRQFTVTNTGPAFQVSEGLYGAPYLVIEADTARVNEVYELVKSGMPGEGLPRLDMAGKIREVSSPPANPAPEPDQPGPGPKLTPRCQAFADLVKLNGDYLGFMGKAGKAKEKKKKAAVLYWGLRAKIALLFKDKKTKKVCGALMAELGKDLDEGKLELTPGGWWSSFVDSFAFYELIRHPNVSGYLGAIQECKQRLQGVLTYHKTLPQSPALATRSEILAARLAIIEKMLEINDL